MSTGVKRSSAIYVVVICLLKQSSREPIALSENGIGRNTIRFKLKGRKWEKQMLHVKLNESGAIEKYPYTLKDLRSDYSNTSFPVGVMEMPEVLSAFNVEVVAPSEAPTSDTHYIEEQNPTESGGVWTQSWAQREMSEAERFNHQALTAVENRVAEYGALVDQIEFITENGLEAWQSKVAEIKAKYPKPPPDQEAR